MACDFTGGSIWWSLYGVIFCMFYLGSGLGIFGLSSVREIFGNYDTGLFIVAGILLSCVVLTAFLPAYKYTPSTR